MNIKYNKLSVIGKVWSLAELYNAGIRDDKKPYVDAAIRKLEELESDSNSTSFAIGEKSISNILRHIMKETEEFVDDGTLVSSLWYNRAWLDDVKSRIKNNQIEDSDLAVLQDIYLEIKRFYVKNLKEKKFSSKEKQDLFKIKEEILNLKNKIENRVERNQINVKQ